MEFFLVKWSTVWCANWASITNDYCILLSLQLALRWFSSLRVQIATVQKALLPRETSFTDPGGTPVVERGILGNLGFEIVILGVERIAEDLCLGADGVVSWWACNCIFFLELIEVQNGNYVYCNGFSWCIIRKMYPLIVFDIISIWKNAT